MKLEHLSKLVEATKKNKKAQLQDHGVAGQYGLILVTSDAQAEYDDFDSTEVYLDEKSFDAAVKQLFAQHVSNVDVEDMEMDDLYDHEEWEEFCEHVWMVRKFR